MKYFAVLRSREKLWHDRPIERESEGFYAFNFERVELKPSPTNDMTALRRARGLAAKKGKVLIQVEKKETIFKAKNVPE